VRRLAWFAVAGALLVASGAAAQYVISESVVGCGGGMSTGPGGSLMGTVGQPAIGVTSGPSNIHEIGFWYLPGWILTGVDEEPLPTKYSLGHGFPNPFNPSAQMRFSVPSRGRVTIALYNVAGQEVRELIDKEMDPGLYTVPVNGDGLAGGVYFCRMVSGTFVEARKMVLLK